MFSSLDDTLDWNSNNLYFLCDQDPVEEIDTSATHNCSTLLGSNVFFGNCGGILSENPEEADEKWPDFEIEVSFDCQVVDLLSFRLLNTEFPPDPSQDLRMWNLVVENITPGTHTIQCK